MVLTRLFSNVRKRIVCLGPRLRNRTRWSHLQKRGIIERVRAYSVKSLPNQDRLANYRVITAWWWLFAICNTRNQDCKHRIMVVRTMNFSVILVCKWVQTHYLPVLPGQLTYPKFWSPIVATDNFLPAKYTTASKPLVMPLLGFTNPILCIHACKVYSVSKEVSKELVYNRPGTRFDKG